MVIDKTYRSSFWGSNGFDELKRYLKQGNDFVKDVANILIDRSDLESNYAKQLLKISKKLHKLCMEQPYGVYQAWCSVANQMEEESESHRNFSQLLFDSQKMLKDFDDFFSKSRKPHEDNVAKASKDLRRLRNEERDRSKDCYNLHKDYEKIKENQNKIDKLQKYEGRATNADLEYKKICVKIEEARQSLETSIFKACHEMQILDENRIFKMKEVLEKYNNSFDSVLPIIKKSQEQIGIALKCIDPTKDMNLVVDVKGTGCNEPEQYLMNFYAENQSNTQDLDRRKTLLQSHLQMLQNDISVTVKSCEGIKKTMEVFKRNQFRNVDSYEQAKHGYWQCRAKLEMLEASQYKISRALAEIDGKPIPTSDYENFIRKVSDKIHDTWILKKPYPPEYPGASAERLQTDSNNFIEPLKESSPISEDYDDEFAKSTYGTSFDDSFEDEHDNKDKNDEIAVPPKGKYRALYNYKAQNADELSITANDILIVVQEFDNGWYLAEYNGILGNVPGNYLEKI